MNFTKLGFILATLGSSIGLGHIWRFPYIAGENGGSAFVVVYTILTIFIGIPILVAKMVIGNKSQKNAVSAFSELNKKSRHWNKAGIMVIGGPLILTYYAVVLGWVFYYLFIVSFNLPSDINGAESVFNNFVGHNILASFIAFVACMMSAAFIVSRGVKRGLEKYNLILMPMLFLIFFGLFLYAITLDSFIEACKFLFAFKIERLNPSVIIMALSQVFFSLSIGVGVIISYSSSARKGENLLSSAAWVALSGIIISLVAGLIIFTFLFNANQAPNSGVGMLFISLPYIFGNMPYGGVISFLFFLAVLFAGITSAMSILEPPVAYLAYRFNISRAKSSFGISAIIILIGGLTILSLSAEFGEYLRFFDKTFFDWLDFFTAAIVMPLGALAAILFITRVMDKKYTYKFVRKFMSKNLFNIWFFIIKYLAPIVILGILIAKFIDTFLLKIGGGL